MQTVNHIAFALWLGWLVISRSIWSARWIRHNRMCWNLWQNSRKLNVFFWIVIRFAWVCWLVDAELTRLRVFYWYVRICLRPRRICLNRTVWKMQTNDCVVVAYSWWNQTGTLWTLYLINKRKQYEQIYIESCWPRTWQCLNKTLYDLQIKTLFICSLAQFFFYIFLVDVSHIIPLVLF